MDIKQKSSNTQEEAKNENSPLPWSLFRSISKPIVMMIDEHRNADQRFSKITEISKNYSIPEDASIICEVTLKKLKDFGSIIPFKSKLYYIDNNK